MRTETGDVRLCMEMANATTRMLIYWKPVMNNDLGSLDMYPSIYNYAFTCELYLKAILMHRSLVSEFPKTHDLEKLYERLDGNDQDAIRQKYDSIINYSIKRDWKKPFSKTLEEMKDVFIDWRYAFSKDGLSINITRLSFLAEAIRSTACRITGIYYVLPELTE